MPNVLWADVKGLKPPKLDKMVEMREAVFIKKLRVDDTSDGLRIKPLHGAADSRARTGRVTEGWRAVLFRLDGSDGVRTYVYAWLARAARHPSNLAPRHQERQHLVDRPACPRDRGRLGTSTNRINLHLCTLPSKACSSVQIAQNSPLFGMVNTVLPAFVSGMGRSISTTGNSCPHFGRIPFAAGCFQTSLDVAAVSKTRVIPRKMFFDVAMQNAQNVFESPQGYSGFRFRPDTSSIVRPRAIVLVSFLGPCRV